VLSLVVFFILGILYLCADNIIVILLTEKWLPSVRYFKILLLGGFAFPFGAFLASIISSRGKSKDFLQMAIIKKMFVGLNLVFGFMIGIEGYLYGRVIVSVVGITITLAYVSRELKISMARLVHPIWPLMLISILIVFLLEYIGGYYDGKSHYYQLIVNGGSFAILYFGLTYFLKLPALNLILNEFGIKKKIISLFY